MRFVWAQLPSVYAYGGHLVLFMVYQLPHSIVPDRAVLSGVRVPRRLITTHFDIIPKSIISAAFYCFTHTRIFLAMTVRCPEADPRYIYSSNVNIIYWLQIKFKSKIKSACKFLFSRSFIRHVKIYTQTYEETDCFFNKRINLNFQFEKRKYVRIKGTGVSFYEQDTVICKT